MTGPALGPGREFDRIRAIARVLGRRAGRLDDDCGLVALDGDQLAISTDVSVEGVHFRRDWMTDEEIGWRAAAAALSDLAAEAALPIGLLAAVTVPAGATDAELAAFMTGVGAAGDSVGAQVLGGDLSGGSAWSAAITVVGRAERPVTRAGAVPGDGLWVTGRLGGARAALESWRAGLLPATEARAAFVHPAPRIREGRWLAAHGARAMIDLSDGLAGDAAHLAAASGVAIELLVDAVPVAPDVAHGATRVGEPAAQFAAVGGEDYELLAALPPGFGPTEATAFGRAFGLPLTRVGTVEPGAGVRATLGGRAVSLRGFDHFG